MERLQGSIQAGAFPGTSIIKLIGPVTLATQFVMEEAFRRVSDDHTILDVLEVPYIDSAGLGAIIAHFSHTQRNAKGFAMTGVSRRIQLLLELTHVNKILPVFPTNADAELSFRARA